jgi:hypothetical protein
MGCSPPLPPPRKIWKFRKNKHKRVKPKPTEIAPTTHSASLQHNIESPISARRLFRISNHVFTALSELGCFWRRGVPLCLWERRESEVGVQFDTFPPFALSRAGTESRAIHLLEISLLGKFRPRASGRLVVKLQLLSRLHHVCISLA